AGWVVFLHERARSGTPIADPHAATMAELAAEREAPAFAHALAERDIGLTRKLLADPALMAALDQALKAIAARDWAATPLAG
ncbi:hypothetical protein NL474_28055, partial [Klebsiella pneumoniae]|nr:hypothetical protein [Klebsiella pneumoniae]